MQSSPELVRVSMWPLFHVPQTQPKVLSKILECNESFFTLLFFKDETEPHLLFVVIFLKTI